MKPFILPEKYLDFKIFQKHQEMVGQIFPQKISANYDNFSLPNTAKNLAYLFALWGEGFPLYCVRHSLLEDMLATDVGENLALFERIELEIPCFALFFPRGKVASPHNGSVDYLIINHEQIDTDEHKHLISWGGIDSEGRMLLSAKRIRRDGTLKRSRFTNDDKSMQQRVLNIRNIVLQSILLLQYYPQIVSDYQPAPSKGFSQKPAHESKYRLPRWLGEISRNSHSKTATGVGKGKATHFRRGHWRLIQGEKLVHVRPAWVNP